jgi:hypothetical protein
VEISEPTPEVITPVSVNPFTCSPEEFQRRLEAARIARATAIKKGAYSRAIAFHCRSCKGPTREDCRNIECKLFPVRNPQARRGQRKKDLRFAIRDECRDCVGSRDDLCQSKGCFLFPLRFGRKRLDLPLARVSLRNGY